MPLHLWFGDDSVSEWIARGAPLGAIDEFTHFGDGESVRTPEFEIANKAAFEAYMEPDKWGALFARQFWLDFRLGSPPIELTFWEHTGANQADRDRNQLDVVRHADALFTSMDCMRPMYGCAYVFDEWAERNLYRYQTSWAKRPNTSPVGRDVTRYVPGLYWMTCFSDAYAASHHVDLKEIAGRLSGTLRRLSNCTVLQLYERPEDWREHHSRIAEALRTMPQFFSLDRLERLPPGLSMREIIDETLRVTRPWP